MRPKCVKNASDMRQNGSCFYWEKRNVQNASEIRQNCVKNASKMRGTPLGENTFWTIPNNYLVCPSNSALLFKADAVFKVIWEQHFGDFILTISREWASCAFF